MDHVKELELEMLLKFVEVGGIISYGDFEKVFPTNISMWSAIRDGLIKDEYCTVGQYSMQNNVVGRAFGITDSGRVRIVQLQQEKVEEVLTADLTKGVSGWTRSGAIGAWVAAGLTLLGIIVTLYFDFNPFRSNEYYSKAMDSITLVKFKHAMDSITKVTNDSIAKSQASDTVIVYNADRKPVVYPKGEPPPPPPTKAIEKHPDKAILDSLEILSPIKNQLVEITYEKGNRNKSYAVELAELLNKNGYTKVTTLEDLGGKRSEKKVYFIRLEQGYILVYVNVY